MFLNTVKPLHNCHYGDKGKWLLKKCDCYGGGGGGGGGEEGGYSV